jgi:hypothetical protein
VCCREKLRDLYPPPNDQIKENEMVVGKSVCNVWGGGEKRNAFMCLVGKREERRPVRGMGVLGRIILKWNLNRMADHGLG